MNNAHEQRVAGEINGKIYAGTTYVGALRRAINEIDKVAIASQAQYLIQELKKKPSFFDNEIEFLSELKEFLYNNYDFKNAHELVDAIGNFLFQARSKEGANE